MMYRLFVFFLLSILINSCLNKKQPTNALDEVIVPKGKAFIQLKGESQELMKVMRYAGIRYLEDIKIKVNTENSHYAYFAAVADFPVKKYDDGSIGGSSKNGELNFITRIGGCFFWEQLKDSTNLLFTEEILSSELMIDKKMNDILGNDSIYISMDGSNYTTLPKEMKINGGLIHQFNNELYDLSGIVPIYAGDVELIENAGNEDIRSRLLVGMYSFDCGSNYDFNEMYRSEEFIYCLFNPGAISRMQSDDPIRFEMNDFILSEDDNLSIL